MQNSSSNPCDPVQFQKRGRFLAGKFPPDRNLGWKFCTTVESVNEGV
jgi:hypothetical protein